ncbi:MAG: hypothetical protein RLY70_1482 [Planctomycetota bacterium]|jgi:prolyl oligopeptidase
MDNFLRTIKGWILMAGIAALAMAPGFEASSLDSAGFEAAAMAAEPADPHQWLEEVGGDKQLSWVKERNAESAGPLTADPGFEPLRGRFLEILNSTARIPMIAKHGAHYYNFWRDAKNKRGLWRRTTLEEYRQPEPRWEIVVDLDALAAAEKENWVWKGASFLEPACERVLVSLSRGGADATVVREFDVTTKRFVDGGFQLPEAKSRVSWRGPDSLFVATDFGPGSLTDSGYPRVVKQWERGQPLADAPVVFEGRAADVSVSGSRDLTEGFERDYISRALTFWTNELYVRRDNQWVKIDKPDDANAFTHREWLLIELRSDWTVGDRTYPAGAQLITRLDDFLAGKRQFDLLFEPSERKSLAGVSPTRHHFIVNELDNVRSRVYVVTLRDGRWSRVPLPGAPELGTLSVSAVDPDHSDAYFLTVSDYLTPTTLRYGVAGEGPAETLKANPSFFVSKGLRVSQREAVSKDGTRVPYFEIARADLALDGSHPAILYGYGGFEIPMLPGYQPLVGAGWLERGGVYAVANIRGGGEFGPRWHQAALKANRHRAYEDFAAVADDMVKRGVTSPKKLGAIGGSNGGLLMGNMLTLYPDRFGAIVCQVPLLDMRRYHRLLAGASWVAEYGDPESPVEWEFLRTFSPYHNVAADGKYPPVLFTTSTRDDRVHPAHARKMVARMREQGHRVAYYENIEGGHGGAADNPQTAYMWALAYTFLWRELTGAAPGTPEQAAARLAPPTVVRLWPGRAPGPAAGDTSSVQPESEVVRKEERKATRITNISEPTLSIYPPRDVKPNGAAVIVCPGGGYNYVVVDKEGTEAIAWLNSLGITGVLLKYRVPPRPDRPKHAAPLEDAQRAIGLLRQRSAEFGVRPDRIGIMGFSAGGHVAALASTRFAKREYAAVDAADEISCRPDFSLLIYPAYLTVRDAAGERLAPDLPVDSKTPPAFLMQTQDDSVRVESAIYYYLALKNAKVPGELHVYPSGGHGYGLRVEGRGLGEWPTRAADWLSAGGWR